MNREGRNGFKDFGKEVWEKVFCFVKKDKLLLMSALIHPSFTV